MDDRCSAWEVVSSGLRDIGQEAWDQCANPALDIYNPFLSYAFLSALEESGCATGKKGWAPCHFALHEANGKVAAVMPCYLKGHSYGEYVFDHAWADAYERAGGRYYPKLQTAVPFTPVTGRRVLVRPEISEEKAHALLASAAMQLAKQNRVSSWHITFATQPEWKSLGQLGLLQRKDTQYHWFNQGYSDFDDFLGALASRKRKTMRKEREHAHSSGIEIEWLTGSDIKEAHWDAFFEFYMETSSRKWGVPYLNRRFFSLVGERMADRILLIMCRREAGYVAGALNFIGGDTLYGRYWGCIESHNFLHFETCYYQAIDYAIAHKFAVLKLAPKVSISLRVATSHK